MQVDIPWTKLGSKPVKVLLQGVSVLVGPVDRDSWREDEVRGRRLGIKRAALEKAEAAAKKERGEKGNDDAQVWVRLQRKHGTIVVLVFGTRRLVSLLFTTLLCEQSLRYTSKYLYFHQISGISVDSGGPEKPGTRDI